VDDVCTRRGLFAALTGLGRDPGRTAAIGFSTGSQLVRRPVTVSLRVAVRVSPTRAPDPRPGGMHPQRAIVNLW
jgi:hypothetical protein